MALLAAIWPSNWPIWPAYVAMSALLLASTAAWRFWCAVCRLVRNDLLADAALVKYVVAEACCVLSSPSNVVRN